jgi:hypothetical protein
MKTQKSQSAMIEPQTFDNHKDTMNPESEQLNTHDLDFMDRMFDAANDMGTDDWGDCMV